VTPDPDDNLFLECAHPRTSQLPGRNQRHSPRFWKKNQGDHPPGRTGTIPFHPFVWYPKKFPGDSMESLTRRRFLFLTGGASSSPVFSFARKIKDAWDCYDEEQIKPSWTCGMKRNNFDHMRLRAEV
jgi:hypothetical protein